MAGGLENRVRLFDSRIVAIGWSCDAYSIVRCRGITAIGQKMGFGAPIDSWLRNPLRDRVEAILAPTRLAPAG
jgi:hypothetical protein